MQVEVDVVLRIAAFEKTYACTAKPEPDDELVDPLSIGVVCNTKWIGVQKAAIKDRTCGNLLDMVVVLDVAALACAFDAFWHAALHIQIEATRQWPVEPVVVPYEQRRLKWQDSQMATIVGFRWQARRTRRHAESGSRRERHRRIGHNVVERRGARRHGESMPCPRRQRGQLICVNCSRHGSRLLSSEVLLEQIGDFGCSFLIPLPQIGIVLLKSLHELLLLSRCFIRIRVDSVVS